MGLMHLLIFYHFELIINIKKFYSYFYRFYIRKYFYLGYLLSANNNVNNNNNKYDILHGYLVALRTIETKTIKRET